MKDAAGVVVLAAALRKRTACMPPVRHCQGHARLVGPISSIGPLSPLIIALAAGHSEVETTVGLLISHALAHPMHCKITASAVGNAPEVVSSQSGRGKSAVVKILLRMVTEDPAVPFSLAIVTTGRLIKMHVGGQVTGLS